jgi:nitrogen regulatory protein PII
LQAEADAIPRKTATGGFYKSKIYVYTLESVVRAVKKKHGSLYLMAKNNAPH